MYETQHTELPASHKLATGEFVTFMLDDEEYGVSIQNVQEIIGYKTCTKLPNVADFILGVLNLRGIVVPVIDLRTKFSLKTKPFDKYTVIVIVEIYDRIMGIIVDAVTDVITLDKKDIRRAPPLASKIGSKFIVGMAESNDKFIILLDINSVLSTQELQEVDSTI